ncbi:MAG: hypothetical protein LBV74_08285 [Tannerella sp.]|jgi:hypothetical protein|nr:hypothetical protein [Tannerella sp.]
MKIFLTSICCFLIICHAFAQKQDDILVIDNNISSYLETTKNYASIYSGKEEPRYKVKIINHPYLDIEEFRRGTLSFDGRVYPDVMIRLNQDLEELAILSPDKSFSILAPRDRVEYATIDSLFIIYHKPVSADGRALPEGYYVRMYNGECQVWKRKTSFLNSRINDMVLEYFFENNTKIYIRKNGIYYPVSTKRSVLKLFASEKKELKKIIRKSGLIYKENPERAIVTITGFYDNLNK